MNKTSLSITILVASGILVSCSSIQTTVIPKAQGHYQVIATANNSADARKGAIDQANKVCRQQSKQLVVSKAGTTYQGSGKELGDISQAVSSAAFANSGVFVPTTKTNTDYRTTVTFKCN